MESANGETNRRITVGDTGLDGDLTVPDQAAGLVLFAGGGDAGDRDVAAALGERGLATLVVPLTGTDLGDLGDRLIDVVDWAHGEPSTAPLPSGIFGGGVGAQAALLAAAARPEVVRAVVCADGRPDELGPALVDVLASTLFLVGEHDTPLVDLNEEARAMMQAHNELRVVPAVASVFDEPKSVGEVADLAGQWFRDQFEAPPAEEIE